MTNEYKVSEKEDSSGLISAGVKEVDASSGKDGSNNFRSPGGIKELSQQLKILSDTIQQQDSKIDNIKNELNDTKQRVVETLAVFVAVFTFVSIDFQILKLVTNIFSAIGLMLTSAGLLILFPLLVDYFFNPKSTQYDKFKKLNRWVIWLILGGILLSFIGTLRFVSNNKWENGGLEFNLSIKQVQELPLEESK